MASFLNSVLSTIIDSNAQLVKPTVQAPASTSEPTPRDPKKVVFRSNTHPQLSNGSSISGKRKAEVELSRAIDKAQRRDVPPSRQDSSGGLSDKVIKLDRPALTVSSVSSGPYRGTSKPSPVTPLSAEGKAPKKGSFAEIMARGKPTIPPVGIITHKPKDKISSKKELELQKKELAMRGKRGGKMSKSAPGSKSSSPGPSKRADSFRPDGKVTKPVGYQGTSKPKPQPSYKGTMKTVSPLIAPPRKKEYNGDGFERRKSLPFSQRAESYDEVESEVEDGNSHLSEEDYSDMEAGFEDVEEEDERAARLAKKEDNYENMMLEELKRQKEAKKQRLAAQAEKERTRRH